MQDRKTKHEARRKAICAECMLRWPCLQKPKPHVGKSPQTTEAHVKTVVEEINTDGERPIKVSSQPNLTLEQLAKNM